MSKDTSHERVEHLRARAEEIRTKAETMYFADPRTMMLQLAATYDKLADRIEDGDDEALQDYGS